MKALPEEFTTQIAAQEGLEPTTGDRATVHFVKRTNGAVASSAARNLRVDGPDRANDKTLGYLLGD